MTYFDLFGLKPSFYLDKSALRKKFYQLSRDFHPDHQDGANSAKNIEQATFCNQAYKTLSEDHLRIPYVLRIFNILKSDENETVDTFFLMEMMELNEQLEAIQMAKHTNIEELNTLKTQCSGMLENCYAENKTSMESFDSEQINNSELEEIKKNYFRYKYLLRFQENLNKFAAA